ncbi:MAG: hypothetical protein C0609_08075 [Deltaproteobacteria bacterium]|nr:MAG: hypothetical protein C0609_08075 [Deltaproteobacteria bacterium]
MGCAAVSTELSDEGLTQTANISPLYGFNQRENQCGPASLATILRWSGVPDATPEALLPTVYTPAKEGSFLHDIAGEIRAHGRLAHKIEPKLAALFREVESGHPVLVLENRGLSFSPLYHYSVLAGYDLTEETVTLYQGEETPAKEDLDTFSRTWARSGSQGLLALPPGELPADGGEGDILTSIIELEGAGQTGAALAGYKAFIRRFPKSWRGHFSLGGALYLSGESADGVKHLKAAAHLAPDRPEPLNNLALAAHGDGRLEDAVRYADEAISKARAQGLDLKPYQDTLKEVGGAFEVEP